MCVDHIVNKCSRKRKGDKSGEMFFKMAEIGLTLGNEAPYTARLKTLEERRK